MGEHHPLPDTGEHFMSETAPEPVVEPTEPVTPAPEADPPKPTAPDTGEKDWAAEAAKWKALARKHEDASKANADKAKRLDELEESQKTEQQKAADKAAAAEAKATEAAAELARMRAAVKHGLTEDDLDLLGTHGTPEEIEERAEKLAARLKAVKPKADFGAGDRGTDVVGKAKQLSADDVKRLYAEKKYDEIEAARKDGRLTDLLG